MMIIIQRLLQTPIQRVPGLGSRGLLWSLYQAGIIRPRFALRYLWIADWVVEWELWLRDGDDPEEELKVSWDIETPYRRR